MLWVCGFGGFVLLDFSRVVDLVFLEWMGGFVGEKVYLVGV